MLFSFFILDLSVFRNEWQRCYIWFVAILSNKFS
jgi:hypothetical protein